MIILAKYIFGCVLCKKKKTFAAHFDLALPRYDHAKEGRLTEKEFYNVVALQHKVPCTLKEVPLNFLLSFCFHIFTVYL